MEVLEAPTTADAYGLDQDFLERVDRATHHYKVHDPLQLDRVHLAIEEELRMNRSGGY
jgi:hypothetical protein